MAKKNNFYVIGGQYEPHCYGGAPTLIGAKRLANKSAEYWDNWQGWHTPAIYKAENTEVITAHGYITHYDGTEIRVPKFNAFPVLGAPENNNF